MPPPGASLCVRTAVIRPGRRGVTGHLTRHKDPGQDLGSVFFSTKNHSTPFSLHHYCRRFRRRVLLRGIFLPSSSQYTSSISPPWYLAGGYYRHRVSPLPLVRSVVNVFPPPPTTTRVYTDKVSVWETRREFGRWNGVAATAAAMAVAV